MADPVADFLAREQDMLAELDGAAAPPPLPPAADEERSQVSPNAPSQNSEHPSEGVAAGLVDDFGQMAVAGDIPSADSGVDLAAMDFGAAPAAFAIPAANEAAFAPESLSNGRSSSGPSPVPAFPRIEAENIRKWREQQREMLEKKDAAEDKKKDEWRAQAKKDLEDWYAQRDAALLKAKENNKKQEEEYAQARAREQGSDAAWDEIAKLCDSKPKAGQKDVSRLKSLLLHLKEQRGQ